MFWPNWWNSIISHSTPGSIQQYTVVVQTLNLNLSDVITFWFHVYSTLSSSTLEIRIDNKSGSCVILCLASVTPYWEYYILLP